MDACKSQDVSNNKGSEAFMKLKAHIIDDPAYCVLEEVEDVVCQML
jgi:hypothetical protein